MEALDNIIIEPIEKVFDSVGMMQGDMAPLKRAATGAAIGAAIVYGLQPDFLYDKVNKKYKVFAGTATKDEAADATWFPWWAVIGIPAAVFGVLI